MYGYDKIIIRKVFGSLSILSACKIMELLHIICIVERRCLQPLKVLKAFGCCHVEKFLLNVLLFIISTENFLTRQLLKYLNTVLITEEKKLRWKMDQKAYVREKVKTALHSNSILGLLEILIRAISLKDSFRIRK